MISPDALRRLSDEFEQIRTGLPGLRHALIEVSGNIEPGSFSLVLPSRGERFVSYTPASPGLSTLGHYFYTPKGEWGDAPHAYEEFCKLARAAVTLLIYAGKVRPEDAPNGRMPVAFWNYWANRLMAFVHELARVNQSVSWLSIGPGGSLLGHQLPEGESAYELVVDVFEGASLALKIVADELEHGTIDSSETDARLMLFVHRFGELHHWARAYYKALGELRFEFQTHPAPVLERNLVFPAYEFLARAEGFNASEIRLRIAAWRATNQLCKTIRDQFVRWGWPNVPVHSEVQKRLSEAFRDADARYDRFLSAVLAWRLNDNLTTDQAADQLADEARRRGLLPAEVPPGSTYVWAKELAKQLESEWRCTPSLGGSMPRSDQTELARVARCCEDLERAHRELMFECFDTLRNTWPNAVPQDVPGLSEGKQPPTTTQTVGSTKSPSSPSGNGKGKDKVPSREKTERIRGFLKRYPDKTSTEVAHALGFPEQTVRSNAAWKAHQNRKRKSVPVKSVKERPLSDSMLRARPAEERNSSAEVGDDELFEIQERRFLESVDNAARAKYHKLSTSEKLEMIADFLMEYPEDDLA